MHIAIRTILGDYDPNVLGKVEAALSLCVTNFKRDLFPALKRIDEAIPGAGFQFVIWVGHSPRFPFPGWEFDAIARPMKYIPDLLASGMRFTSIARFVAQSSGGHAEECVKELCYRLNLPVTGYDKMPLGRLARNQHVVAALGTGLAGQVWEYANILVNAAKHEYASGSPEPVISFPDALGGYFASRILGSQILDKAGILDDYLEAIRLAHSYGRVYSMPPGLDPGDDNEDWPLQNDLSTLREDAEQD